MNKEGIPADVRRFVLTSIPSVPFLEALLLLRSAAASGWSARELARRLYVPEATGLELLQRLHEAGFAERAGPDTYRYAPAPALAAMVDRLEHCYATRLVDVTALIHAKVDKRAQQFADAFRWKKEP
ncbi:MAG TPA: hypothetical protein VKD22_00080 [Ramlibacter sp.]|nr:hypothetical protein [Ramlibacter sp.]